MTDEHFDLRDEPWIRVRTAAGIELLSIRQTLRLAPEIRSLAGELPTQDAAILRMLLVILSRALDEDDDDPIEIARRWWHLPELPLALADSYLDRCANRFDLWDATAPFLQVADLSAGKTSGLTKLIADVPDGHEFFTTRTASALTSLSYAEAARWLVHAQAFDPSGIKTGAVGDDRVKGGKGYPIGTGWTGRCGLVVLEGDNLKETLLLNLVLDQGDIDDGDLPVWERRPLTASVEAGHLAPRGWRDIFTWPSRRILLYRDHGRVVDVLLSNGDRLDPQNRQRQETMTAWRRSKNQEKTHGVPTYMPAAHDPARKMWRGLGGMLVQRPTGGAVSNEPPARLGPTNLAWVARLRDNRVIDPHHQVKVRAVGMSYGTQDASVVATTDDKLTMRLAVVTDDRLRQAAVAAVDRADAAVQQIVQLAGNLAEAAGRESDGPRNSAREDAFSRLERPYSSWLRRLSVDTDIEAAETEWQSTVRSVLTALADELVSSAGESAWVGRQARGRHIDTSLAHLWFLFGLHKELPLAYPEQKKSPQDVPTEEPA